MSEPPRAAIARHPSPAHAIPPQTGNDREPAVAQNSTNHFSYHIYLSLLVSHPRGLAFVPRNRNTQGCVPISTHDADTPRCPLTAIANPAHHVLQVESRKIKSLRGGLIGRGRCARATISLNRLRVMSVPRHEEQTTSLTRAAHAGVPHEEHTATPQLHLSASRGIYTTRSHSLASSTRFGPLLYIYLV